MADISSMTLPSGDSYNLKDIEARKKNIYFGTCSTAAATQAKTVTIDGITQLYEGLNLRIKFVNAQTYNGVPTLNINNLGAKNIGRYSGTNAGRYEWLANEILDLVYDGTRFVIIDAGIATTTYYGVTKLYNGAGSTSTNTALVPAALHNLCNGSIAPYYSASATYAVGDKVRYGNNLYECTTAITTAEAWTDAHWTVLPTLLEMTEELQTVIIHGNNTNLATIGTKSAILVGTFTLNSTLSMAVGQTLRGINATVTVGSNAKIQMHSHCIIDGIKFVGDWNVTRQASGYGWAPLVSESDLATESTDVIWGTNNAERVGVIHTTAEDSVGTEIINNTFLNIRKCCILCSSDAHTSKDSYLVSNNTFIDCWLGIGVFGEFGRFVANKFFRVIIGTYLYSGNISKVGLIYKGCDCGIYYSSDLFEDLNFNGGHGETVGCEFAHCGVAGLYIKILQRATGDVITGCQFADAAIIGELVYGLKFVGCRLDTYFKIASGGNNSIVNNNIRTAYLGSNQLYSVPADTIIRDNVPIGTAGYHEVNPIQTVKFNLASAISNANGYGIYDEKTDSVRINGRVTSSTDITTSTNLFTIPEGYRPASNQPVYATFVTSSSTVAAYWLIVGADGTVKQPLGNSIRTIFFSGEYPLHG